MGQAGRREDRQLLTPYKGQQRIDDRHAGQDRVPRDVAHSRIEGRAGDRAGLATQHGWAAVEGLPHTVPHPSQPPPADGDLERTAFERHGHPLGIDAARPLEDLHNRQVPVDFEDEAPTDLTAGKPDRRDLVPAHSLHAADHQQGPLHAARARVLDRYSGQLVPPGRGGRRCHASPSSARSCSSRRVRTASSLPGPVSSRARVTGVKSNSSTAEAGSPPSTSAWQRS